MTTRRAIQLTESVQQTHGKLRVDREKGIIFGVKFLGTTSANRHGHAHVEGTEYAVDAIRKALPLYEGRKVCFNHPANRNAKAERQFQDLAGCLRNCRVDADGGFADLHYVKGDQLCEKLATVAESMPDQVGMSHNADGEGRVNRQRK